MKKTLTLVVMTLTAAVLLGIFRPWSDQVDAVSLNSADLAKASGTGDTESNAPTDLDTKSSQAYSRPNVAFASGGASLVVDSKTNIKSLLDAEGQLAKTEPSLAYVLATELFKCHQFDTMLTSSAADKLGSDNNRFVKATSARCTGLSPEDKWKFLEYLEYAARMGNVEAQIMYASVGSRSIFDHSYALQNPEETALFKQTAMNYLNQAARTGSAEAMRSLAHAFEAGVITEENRINAVAMMTAAQRRAPLVNGEGALAALSRTLTAAELAQANEIADAFLKDCCNTQ